MHSKSPRWFPSAVILFVVALLAASAPPALAHAVLVSSTPQKNAAVSGPDITINLKYNSRVDGARSSLSLLSATGHGLAKGAYVLRWQVLATDGHITRGEVPFQVQ
jgi:methionine-rich copper-binding protein CopC